jgi:TonB-linked SusC/RagA family outer membrane protein
MILNSGAKTVLMQLPTIKTLVNAMKITIALIIMACMQVSASSYGQLISLTAKNKAITTVFSEIEKQSDYSFFWKGDEIKKYNVSINAKALSIEEVLNNLFKSIPYTYSITKKTIVIQPKSVVSYAELGQFNFQETTIKIVDTNRLALPRATILVKETGRVFSTNENGEISSSEFKVGTTLVISYLGYNTKEVKITSNSPLQIVLSSASSGLNEIVVVGYGNEKRQNLSTAISSIQSTTIEKLSVTRVEQALQGNAPGVLVLNQNGQPGDKPMIRIRGTGTNNNPDPLFIVDGFPVSTIEHINPGDIDRIDVLKDAASSAIYGARGANGVILITSKKGTPGKTSLTYDGYYGTQNRWKKVDLLNATQYAEMINMGLQNANPTNPAKYANPSALGLGTDWQEAIFRKNAPIFDHQISASGGSDKATYMVKFSYFGQQGIVGSSDSKFDRYTIRLNLDQKVTNYLKIGTNINYISTDRKAIFDNGDQGGHALGNAVNLDPITPLYETDPAKLASYNINAVRDANGIFGISPEATFANPLAQMAIINNKRKLDKLLGNVYAELSILKDLKFRSSYGLDIDNENRNDYSPLYYLLPTSNQPYARVRTDFFKTDIWQIENVLTYNLDKQKHSLQLTAGQSAYKYFFQNLSGKRDDKSPIDLDLAYLDVATDITTSETGGGADRRTLASYFGRLSYSYADKYLLSGVIRRDGSSRFGRNNPYATFPSISAGWIVSKEDFFGANAISFLKLRASWGQNGNESLGSSFPWASTINTSNNGYTFVTNTGVEYLQSGASLGAIANPDLKWETSEQTNIGLDINFLKNKLAVSADYYVKATKDLLIRPGILASVGYGAPFINGGNVENRGIELGINYNEKLSRDWSLGVSFNISHNKNEVTRINNAAQAIAGSAYISLGSITRMSVGEPIGYFWGQRTAGIFQTQAEIDAYTYTNPTTNVTTKIQPNAKPGDVKFVNTNNDGVINDNDRVNIGNPNPKFISGLTINLSYKDFDLSIFGIGMFGHQLFNGNYRFDKAVSNMPATMLDYWTPTNTDARYPRFITTDPNKNYSTVSDLLLESGNFVRIKNIQLGYTIPQKLTSKIRVNGFRVFMASDNAFTFTKYSGFDPEIGATSPLSIGIDRGVYPQARSIRFGVNVKL